MVDVCVPNIDECRLEEDVTSVLLVPEDNGSNKSDDNKIYVEEVVPIVFGNDGTGDVINANKDIEDIISLN